MPYVRLVQLSGQSESQNFSYSSVLQCYFKDKIVILLSCKLLHGSLKNGKKKKSGLCAQNIRDVRIHFKEWLLCKLHLNSWNQHALKPAELGSALISCCFSSLTYFIVPVLLKNRYDFTFYLFKDATHLLFIADSVSHFSAHFIVFVIPQTQNYLLDFPPPVSAAFSHPGCHYVSRYLAGWPASG